MAMTWSELLNPERVRKSTIQDDHRAEFERDFDRAVFSTPVRRLQDKAQVFPLEPHDAIRTRLMHSLEVSSVARGLAIGVGKELLKKKKIDANQARSLEAIAATCGLLHDLGNPPFGHSGEKAIAEWFTKFGEQNLKSKLGDRPQLVQDFLKFEGNAQSLRLVAKLQILADYYGLNLTYGTLSALCKYTAPSHEADEDDPNPARKKPGYFTSEEELVKQIREQTGTGPNRNPITFLVDAADDIVYSVGDVEDAVKKGVFKWKELRELLGDLRVYPTNKVLKLTTRILKSDETGDPLEELPDDVFASAFRTATISVVVKSAKTVFIDRYEQIMSAEFNDELVKSCDAWPLVDKLKTIGRDRVYCTPSTLKLELMGRRVIHDLMDVFWKGAEDLPVDENPNPFTFPGKAGALLSQNYRRVFRHSRKTPDGLPEAYHRFQLVTDYICGMTDSFAKRLHAELFNG